jgi:transcriptional regulator of acetoin/glycerol metabolism
MKSSSPLTFAEVRRRFFDGESLPPGSVPEPILLSWRRCLGLGLPVAGRGGERLERAALSARQEENADWLNLARAQVDSLFESVVDDGHVVIVADRDGVILEESGDPAFLDRAGRVALMPGMDWSELGRGTNAIGTALQLGQSVLVRGSEHYLERNRLLSCQASPIFDPRGLLLGVLDVSGLPRKLGAGIGARVESVARLIEQQLFERDTAPLWRLQFNADPARLGTSRAGRLGFDGDERLVAADRLGLATLQLGREALGRLYFGDLFGETLAHWHARARTHDGLLAWGDRLFSARLFTPSSTVVATRPAGRRLPVAPVAASRKTTAQAAGLPPELTMTGLKLLEADIPVLIFGETGTGKDLFAQALYRQSRRAAAPFVAVNCAAMPEGLIEAELFGYEEGAFTGARRQGSRGRLREAHGGVLFLDEIGDMAPSMQARLLRVLQDRVVTPLGGGGAHPVDIRLICATHRDLRSMVAAGTFRADLYYRLSHYPISLPPLRERGDVAVIAQQLLDAGGAARRGIVLSPPLAAAFRRYRWPGNLRELANLLQTLLALVEDGTELGVDHLPALLRADMQKATACAPASGLAARMLAQFGGNASAAARALGVSRSTFYRRLRQGG